MRNTMVWLAVGGLLLVGCQKTAPANEDSANAAKPQGGFKPGCGGESVNTPDCGGGDPAPEPKPAPEPRPRPEPKEPKPIPSEPRPVDEPRGWILGTEFAGLQAVKATVRCVHNGRIGSATLANRQEAIDQAFADCAN